jgi:hypothetical protein
MIYDRMIKWLAGWRMISVIYSISGFIGGIIFGFILLMLDWLFLVVVVTYFVGRYNVDLRWPLYIATGALPLLFIGNALFSQDDLSQYTVTTATASNKLVVIPGHGSTINPLAPSTAVSFSKVLCDILFAAPRVVVWSLKRIGRIYKLLQLDIDGCAAVLTILYESGGRVAYSEIEGRVDGLNAQQVYRQLHLIDGVLFLASEPPGLTLGSPLRTKLACEV